MGRPIVAFAHGGAVESIEHGKTGWLATPCDVDSLAENIHAAVALEPRDRKAFAKLARAHVDMHFSMDKMCQETLKIYRRMLAKNSKIRVTN